MELQDRFYTSTEVAEILGVSLRSVYRYLEEDKLLADVKTATGRHRFTKQNILDFLYPKGDIPQEKTEDTSLDTSNETNVHDFVSSQETTSDVNDAEDAEDAEDAKDVEEETSDLKDDTEEEVDWLAKFRAAAKKHRAQVAQTEETPTDESTVSEAPQESVSATPDAEISEEVSTQEPTPVEKVESEDTKSQTAPKPKQATSQRETLSSLASAGDEEKAEEKEESVSKETPQESVITYYKSELGGLKELAQYINKTAKKSNVSYAFTLNAGLSLHKLIRPFSLLHIYAKTNDIKFFEKALELTETDKNNAQLGIFTDKNGVLDAKKEIHGLHVVSDLQLRKDLLDEGEVDLASELDSVLNA